MDDCYILDFTKQNKWESIECRANDKFIDGRAWHSASLIKDFIFYFGGMKKNQEISDEVNN